MFSNLPTAGEINEELARQVHPWWLDTAGKADVDVTGFDPEAPVAQRVAWAKRTGLSIATIYSRYSSKRQHSTAGQVRTCVQFAAQNGMYVPPELISIDEGVKGQRIRRDGLERLKLILHHVVCCAEKIEARGDEELQSEIAAVEVKIRTLTNRINDLADLAGQGTEEDRKELKAKVRSAQAERSGLQLELTRLRKAAEKTAATITPDDVRRILGEFTELLEDAANGALGDEAIYKALSVFRRLVGGSIEVHVEPRPGRKRAVVRGKFRPRLVRAVKAAAGLPLGDGDDPGEEVTVWLREPPRKDRYAKQARQLYEEEVLPFRVIGERLDIGCAGAWQAYRRYYQMITNVVLPRRYDHDQTNSGCRDRQRRRRPGRRRSGVAANQTCR